MKTPTLEEVKEYFKNAKEIKAPYSTGIIREIDDFSTLIQVEYGFEIQDKNNHDTYITLYDSEINKYAEIISYKEEIKTDNIVESIINQFKERSKIGIEKYGTTLQENNSDDFLQHLKEELMDAVLYIEKLQNKHYENNNRSI